MKTNVTMIRKMGTFDVYQRTQDAYFNATELLKQWSKGNEQRKDIGDFFKLEKTKEFIEVLENDLKLNNDNFRDSSKSISYIITKGHKAKGESNQYWMHPYLFIDFAMWISPKFKLDVIRFVYDQLIQFRHSSGDNYRGLTSSVQRFSNINYSILAKGLNYIVFNRHEENLRQTATQEQLKQLTELQKQLAFSIDMGYIKSFDELINEMRRIWDMKHKLYFR